MINKKISAWLVVTLFLIPVSLYAQANQGQATYGGEGTQINICKIAISEYLEKHPEDKNLNLTAFGIKIVDGPDLYNGIFIVDILNPKSTDGVELPFKDLLASYKIILISQSEKHILPATIEDRLLALEVIFPYEGTYTEARHREYDRWWRGVYWSIIKGLKADSAEDFNRCIKFIRSRDKNLILFMELTSELMLKLKWDLAVCVNLNKPKEVIRLIGNYLKQASELNDYVKSNSP